MRHRKNRWPVADVRWLAVNYHTDFRQHAVIAREAASILGRPWKGVLRMLSRIKLYRDVSAFLGSR